MGLSGQLPTYWTNDGEKKDNNPSLIFITFYFMTLYYSYHNKIYCHGKTLASYKTCFSMSLVSTYISNKRRPNIESTFILRRLNFAHCWFIAVSWLHENCLINRTSTCLAGPKVRNTVFLRNIPWTKLSFWIGVFVQSLDVIVGLEFIFNLEAWITVIKQWTVLELSMNLWN